MCPNTTNLYFLLIINSGLGRDWTYFLLLVYFYCDGSWLFTLCPIFCLNFMLHIQYPFYHFSAYKKYPLFSILHLKIFKTTNSSGAQQIKNWQFHNKWLQTFPCHIWHLKNPEQVGSTQFKQKNKFHPHLKSPNVEQI